MAELPYAAKTRSVYSRGLSKKQLDPAHRRSRSITRARREYQKNRRVSKRAATPALKATYDDTSQTTSHRPRATTSSAIEINPYPVYPSPYPTSNHRISYDASSSERYPTLALLSHNRCNAPFSLCTAAYTSIIIRGSSKPSLVPEPSLEPATTFCTLSLSQEEPRTPHAALKR